jgi:YbbR domain-containing protein
MRIKSWLLNNIGLKILSLILAILLWVYIAGEQEKINLKSILGHFKTSNRIKDTK